MCTLLIPLFSRRWDFNTSSEKNKHLLSSDSLDDHEKFNVSLKPTRGNLTGILPHLKMLCGNCSIPSSSSRTLWCDPQAVSAGGSPCAALNSKPSQLSVQLTQPQGCSKSTAGRSPGQAGSRASSEAVALLPPSATDARNELQPHPGVLCAWSPLSGQAVGLINSWQRV